MSELRSEEIPVYTAYQSPDETMGDGLTIASFGWLADSSAPEAYTIDVTDAVSLSLDQHTPVRPYSVSVLDRGAEESEEPLTNLFGGELTEAILKARDTLGGLAVINFSLSAENRFAIARRQIESPSTPPLLRRVCENMIAEHERTKPPAARLSGNPIQQGRHGRRGQRQGIVSKLLTSRSPSV